MNEIKEKSRNNPYEDASIFSRWSFWWLKDLFKLGLRKSLDSNDIYENSIENNSSKLKEKFEEIWEDEKRCERPRIINVIWKMSLIKVFGVSILYTFIEIVLRVTQSKCIGGLVSYFSNTHTEPNTTVYWYAVGLIFCAFLSSSFTNPYLMYTFQRGLHIRIALSSIIYNKVIKMRKSSKILSTNGKVINLLSFDTNRFVVVVPLLHHLWKGPIEVFIFGYILYTQIGYYGLIGIAFIVSFIPIQIAMGKMIAKYRYYVVNETDTRVRALNEIIQGIQTIKMHAWEMPFINFISKIRKKELHAIRGVFMIRGVLCSFSIISRLSIFLTLASYVFFGHIFTPAQVFIVTTCFNFLYDSMLYFWTVAVISIAECFVSLRRIDDFLLLPETEYVKNGQINMTFSADLQKMNTNPSTKVIRIEESTEKCIIFKNVIANWNSDNQIGIVDINLQIHENQLVVLTGPIASGKSTILHVILRELEINSGELTVNGVISYASQDPWLFDSTVRKNILFTEPYDKKRYLQVIKICCLERDLQELPAGDLTMVGEAGICLSGGQKARINLARAIYRKADIYLLDDPLSAVDSAVGKSIFNNCIKLFLRDKICILVTHHEQMIKDAHRVVFMNNGRIEHQQTNKMVQVADLNFENFTIKDGPRQDIDRLKKDRKEHQSTGSIGGSVYKSYLKSIESSTLIFLVVILFVAGQISISAIDLTVSKWVNWEIKLKNENVAIKLNSSVPTNNNNLSSSYFEANIEVDSYNSRLMYVYLYAFLIVAALFLVFQRAVTLYILCLQASQKIHEQLLHAVIRANMYFFNTNSSGRIINRFSKDMYDIDYYLALVLYDVTLICLQSVMSLVLVSLTNSIVVIVTLAMSFVFYRMRYIYVSSGRCLRRIEAIGRSAIISHTNATINGLCTIHATKSETILMDEFNALQDHNSSAGFMFKASTRAIAFWLEIICILYLTAAIVIFIVFEKEMSGGSVGLAITQILSLISLSQLGVRQTAELENNMTSFERIKEYIDMKPETDEPLANNKKFENWPKNGSIEFRNVSLKYTEMGDRILKSVNFKIEAGEKVAICGRTGAAKTSIIKALFRMAYNEGTILIDSIDISTIPLQTLRSNLSIIPQDAMLFSGTVRDNLDPFNRNTDDDLWEALDKVELKSTIRDLPNGLDSEVLHRECHLSAGQRSLICLARAILKKNKILILDEATANLDNSTDYLLQKTIRKHFSRSTVITIAHRLHNIMDSDRIMVMDAGQIVEFDHPHRLLQNNDGFLTKLVHDTGTNDSQYLKEMAQKHYGNRFELTSN